MKKLWNGILTMVMLLTLVFCPLTAHADMVWEPEEPFWEAHRGECKSLTRDYRASGEVPVYQSPENDKVVKTLDAGSVFWSSYTYTDASGNDWALYWDEKNGDGTGWIPKASLETVYDYLSFENEYGDQIREESGTLDEKYLEETIYFWDYPGALAGGRINFKDYQSTETPKYEKTFTDEYGHEWGFISYWFGQRNLWICLDKPIFGFEALYDREVPERGVNATKDGIVVEKLINPAEVEKVVPAEDGSNLLVNSVVIFCVLGVIIITAAILRAMKKKNDRRQ